MLSFFCKNPQKNDYLKRKMIPNTTIDVVTHCHAQSVLFSKQ